MSTQFEVETRISSQERYATPLPKCELPMLVTSDARPFS